MKEIISSIIIIAIFTGCCILLLSHYLFLRPTDFSRVGRTAKEKQLISDAVYGYPQEENLSLGRYR